MVRPEKFHAQVVGAFEHATGEQFAPDDLFTQIVDACYNDKQTPQQAASRFITERDLRDNPPKQ